MKVKLSNAKQLIIGSLNVTNKTESKQIFLDERNALFSNLNLNNDNIYYIIAGDFNARHKELGDRKTMLHTG